MRALGRWLTVALALALGGCSVGGHSIGVPATVQCPAEVPSLHPGKAKPRKFALTSAFVRADVCGYSTENLTKPLALRNRAQQTDKAWIRQVVRDLDAMTPPPPGAYSCPMDTGDFALLRLYDGTRRVDVHVDLGGCGFVVGPNGMGGLDNQGLGLLLQRALA